jgi:hypothetical protein
MIRRYAESIIANPGSVGLAFRVVVAAAGPHLALGRVRRAHREDGR